MRTVILLCRRSEEEGCFGFVLNKAYHHTLDELIPELEGINLPVFVGGPVQADTLHYIHQYPDLLPGSLEVSDNIYWGGNFETLKILLQNKDIAHAKIKFFIGYSGWESGQLENEIKEKSWLTVNSTRNIVFDTPSDEIWKASLKHLGGSFEMMINFPTDPQLN